MIVSGILTSLIGLYMDNVIQQTYGTAKKWDYIFSLEYWGCRKVKKHNTVENNGKGAEGS